MTRILLVLATMMMTAGTFAQKSGYVDTQYILDQMPAYSEAQNALNKYSEQWVQEIEVLFNDVQKKKDKLKEEEILLPIEMIKSRQKEIDELEQRAKELQKKRFGVGGDLFLKREELIKPIQDQVFQAIQDIASERGYTFVFDKANQSNMLYADPKFDMSDQVLRKMGVKVVTNN